MERSCWSYRALPALILCSSLVACGGGGGDSNAEPFAPSMEIGAALPGTPINTANAATVAQSASLLFELTEEMEEQVGDVDDLLRVVGGSCRDGGSVAVTDSTNAGLTTRELVYSACRDDDDLYNGRVLLVCASADCTRNGALQFGDGALGYMEQSLESNDRQAVVLAGVFTYTDYSDAADTGRIAATARFQYSDPDGPVGSAQFQDFVYTVTAGASNHELLSFDGVFRTTAFALPSGNCNAEGLASVQTSAMLDDNDGSDQIESGQLQLSSASGDASLSWVAGQLTATAVGGVTDSYNTRTSTRSAICRSAQD